MPIPTGGTQEYRGSPTSLATSGGSITNGSVVQATASNYDTASGGEKCPDGEFALGVTFATAPTEGTVMSLYAQPLDIASTNDTEVPEATRPTRWICNFVVNNVTSLQYILAVGRNLPKLASYYLHNNGTGQTASSGWTLTVTPLTLAPAP
jgi:hypothetical protein